MMADAILTACSVLYVTVPAVIFFWGWLNVYAAVPASLIAAVFALSIFRELHNDSQIINKDNARFWSVTLICMCVWVLLSGIGGWGFQNYDFVARNPIYHDLCSYEWPVIYPETGALSYYFSFWLVPALVSKIFSLTLSGQNICLYLWTVIGIFLTTYNLCKHLRRLSFIIPLLLVFFSGLDVIGFLLKTAHSMIYGSIRMNPELKFHEMLLFGHLEWWPKIFSYSSNTCMLFWVFNQSVPLWVITSMFIQLQDSRNHLALPSLAFAYSPWAAIGFIPIALAASFR